MQIQVNAPNGTTSPDFELLVESTVETVLASQANRLTRVEVHLKDLNAQKGGVDKHCLIEARPRGMNPVTAEHDDREMEDAFRGALDKLSRVLQHRFGKLSARERGD